MWRYGGRKREKRLRNTTMDLTDQKQTTEDTASSNLPYLFHLYFLSKLIFSYPLYEPLTMEADNNRYHNYPEFDYYIWYTSYR